MAIRGQRHLHDSFDPARTALLVIDMQDAFVAEGAVMEVPAARTIVPNINRLADAMRSAGGTVAWIISTYTDQTMDDWASLLRNVMPAGMAGGFIGALKAGADGHGIYGDLKRQDSDLLIEKDRFSAFLQDASNAESVLRDLGIDTLLVTGTVTQVCCESSARDAQMRNFNVVMVADGNASWNEMLHRASLSTWAAVFGDVMTTDDVIERLPASAKAAE